MFADLDETIREMLVQQAQLDASQVDISFDTPDREWASRLTRPTINCFLYDVRENLELRKQAWDVQRMDNGNQSARRKPPLRVSATYQITAWARAREDEHRLLWRVLAILVRNMPLPAEVLKGDLVNQPVLPIPVKVAQEEDMPSNFADLWQALDNRIRPSVTYSVTLALDPAVEITTPLVLVPPRVRVDSLEPQPEPPAPPSPGRIVPR